MMVVSDLKSDTAEDSRIVKDYPDIFDNVMHPSHLSFCLITPMRFYTYYFGDYKSVQFSKKYLIRSVWYYTQATPEADVK